MQTDLGMSKPAAHVLNAVQSEPLQCLMLLLLGELGRVSDLSAFPEVEQFIVRALSEGREDVKATASLALGGVAVGNVSQHLPLLLSRIAELDSTSSKQLYLLLKSLNEVLRTLLARSTPMPPGSLTLLTNSCKRIATPSPSSHVHSALFICVFSQLL